MSNNQKAIVFGGSGFLGSHVADSLTENNYDVTIFDIKDSPYLKNSQKMIIGDILDCQQLKNAIKGNDIVYNFAGIADIDECHKRPIDTIKYNILGNGNILEAAVKNKVEKYLEGFDGSKYSMKEHEDFHSELNKSNVRSTLTGFWS